MLSKRKIIKEDKIYCENCGKELNFEYPYCDDCNYKLSQERHSMATVPIFIMILISISLGIFIIWDIIFMDFSGTVLKICEVNPQRTFKSEYECVAPTYKGDTQLSYYIELLSERTHKSIKIDFGEYPILFNKESYKRLFTKLEIGDYISKSYFSPYYIVNEEVYVLIGSPLQIIIFAGIFIILIPIFLPKFIKDFIRDNKHLGKLRFR
ncbi:MAG: hypothetical protein ACOCV8_02785 [Spirochaetota bacterium]